MFNKITGINELKTLTKHTLCERKCKLGRKCNSNQKWNNDRCPWESKKHYTCEKDYIWNTDTCSCEIGKYLASIFSVITCNEIIDAEAKSYDEETKTVTVNFN